MAPQEHTTSDPAGPPALAPGVDPSEDPAVDAAVPSYVVGGSRLHVGAWTHGLSFYGRREGRDAGFVARHPDLVGSKGTIRLPPEAAAGIGDDELHDFLHATLAG